MVPRFLAAVALLLPTIASAAVTPDHLRRHIEILASDAFEGRAPGTKGEAKTIRYISDSFREAGLEPAAADGGWYQPVPLVVRTPAGQDSQWKGRRSTIMLDPGQLILVGRGAVEAVSAAPVVFAGHGAVMAEHGIDQLAGARLDGAIVLILYDAPDIAGFPSFQERVKAVADRGAAAVIGIIGDNIPWSAVETIYRAPQIGLDTIETPPIRGVIAQEAAARLAEAAGTDLDRLLNGVPGPSFTAVPLELRASLSVRTDTRRFTSNNVVGRLKGKGDGRESLLYLAHWDHFGICRPEGAGDRICNGAVDNASGIAVLIEIARALSEGRRPQRDILFLATTSEETGLLGAEYFARHPPVPLGSIVAALNLDTSAIARKGGKVSVIGRGVAAFDALVAQSAARQGRGMDQDNEADAFLERQDAWPLRRRGVPAALVGGAFSDMAELGRFLSSRYHQPDDDLAADLLLDGAAQDGNLLVSLGRRLANPALYQRPAALAQP
jgi:hypothetical protein